MCVESLKVFFLFSLADSQRECIERFGKQPNARIVNDDDQLCTIEYSRIVPLENGEVKQLTTLLYFPRHKNIFCKINTSRPDCGVTGQRSAGLQKLHLLAGAARLHQGHQHPPALSAHQHPARSPDLQGPERSHGHTQGRHLSLYGLTRTCPAVRLLFPTQAKRN